MKKSLLFLILPGLFLGFAACQGNSAPVVDSVNATATAQEMYDRIPTDVPILEGAYDLNISSSGNSITYRVHAIFEDVIKFYQEQTTSMGWEQLGGEQIMMNSITMQRTKPDKNMSILISAIQNSDEVLVQVMIASR